MTKTDLIETIADKTGLSKAKAAHALNAAIEGITEGLKAQKGGKVTITGFGAFSITRRKARQGVNPQTGQKIMIAASNAVKFKAGKTLKDSVQ